MFFFSKVNNKFSCQTLLKFASICFTAKVVCAFLAKNVTMIFVAQFFQLVSFGSVSYTHLLYKLFWNGEEPVKEERIQILCSFI